MMKYYIGNEVACEEYADFVTQQKAYQGSPRRWDTPVKHPTQDLWRITACPSYPIYDEEGVVLLPDFDDLTETDSLTSDWYPPIEE